MALHLPVEIRDRPAALRQIQALDGAEDIFVSGARYGNIVQGWKKIQQVAVSQDQLIIGIE
jgi:hypothetical protein